MPPSFLLPRFDRLGSDGRIENLSHGGLLGRLLPPVVLVGRDLCSYALFDPGPLPRSQRRRAALFHALANAPYLEAGTAVLPTGRDIGIWWWDLARITSAVAARYGNVRARIRPESLALPPGDGWRIVAVAGGYEAQLWQAGALKVSAWRRTRFDARAWADLTRVHVDGDDPVGPPPAPAFLPIDLQAPSLALGRVELSRAQLIGLGSAAAATGLATLTLYLVGMTWNYEDRTREVERETASIVAETPATSGITSRRAADAKLAAFQAVARSTSPLTAAGAAIGAAAIYDLEPLSLDAETDSVTITLPPSAGDRLDELIDELEGSGYFEDIRPRFEPTTRNLIIEMSVIDGQPPLEDIG